MGVVGLLAGDSKQYKEELSVHSSWFCSGHCDCDCVTSAVAGEQQRVVLSRVTHTPAPPALTVGECDTSSVQV